MMNQAFGRYFQITAKTLVRAEIQTLVQKRRFQLSIQLPEQLLSTSKKLRAIQVAELGELLLMQLIDLQQGRPDLPQALLQCKRPVLVEPGKLAASDRYFSPPKANRMRPTTVSEKSYGRTLFLTAKTLKPALRVFISQPTQG
ncbi:hypothetical protein BGP80_17230 [Pseudomonas putida]|uniref:Uncharacterized protein n=1 Tax=Pseudomonas putida TaxID=303 RepID=A0A2S3WFA1_PSEPU|nr:hypothetical protein BGP80_17230 [Pseudomonas putida]